jgi:hypothetical protein
MINKYSYRFYLILALTLSPFLVYLLDILKNIYRYAGLDHIIELVFLIIVMFIFYLLLNKWKFSILNMETNNFFFLVLSLILLYFTAYVMNHQLDQLESDNRGSEFIPAMLAFVFVTGGIFIFYLLFKVIELANPFFWNSIIIIITLFFIYFWFSPETDSIDYFFAETVKWSYSYLLLTLIITIGWKAIRNNIGTNIFYSSFIRACLAIGFLFFLVSLGFIVNPFFHSK